MACPIHDQRLVDPPPEAGGLDVPVLEGFADLTLLGEGGFAQVFAATRKSDGAQVAIKVATGAHDQRFRREADALARLGPPTAPALWGTGKTPDGRAFVVMEKLQGRTLAAAMEALPGAGAADKDTALRLLRPIAEATDRMHQAELVHRDLKPENIFLRPDGSAALLDFGLARAFGAVETEMFAPNLTQTGQRLGTDHYISPEQCQDSRDVGLRADLYSLAVIAFELLTGRPPFVGSSADVVQGHMSRRPPRTSELARLPEGVDAVMLRALAKDPQERFDSAAALVAALDEALRAPVAEKARPAAKPAEKAKSSVRPVALLGVRSEAPATHLVDVAAPEGGRLARVLGDRTLIAFPEDVAIDRGVRAALRVARQLWAARRGGDEVVIHVADLRVRHGASGIMLMGASLDTSDGWWPPPGDGVRLTELAAKVAGDAVVVRSDGAIRLKDDLAATGVSLTPPEQIPMRGREEVMDALASSSRRAFSEGQPALATVIGEIGMGKTRLIAEVRAHLPREAVVFDSRGLRPELGASETAIRRLIGEVFGLQEGADASAIERACAARLEPDDATHAWPILAYALGALPEEDPRVAPTLHAPGAARHTIARAVARAIIRLAQQQPVALLLDDAQWADPVVLDAFELATAAEAKGSLWACVAALPALDSARPAWGDRAARAERHVLGPLDAASARHVLRALLAPIEYVSEAVLARIEEASGRTPLYLAEIVNALRASGAIRPQSGSDAWVVAADELLEVSVAPLADRLAGSVLGSLTGPVRAVAHLAAVLGEAFSIDELAALQRQVEQGAPGLIDTSLDVSIAAQRLSRGGLFRVVERRRYAFRHPLLRDATEAQLSPDLKRALHEAALEMLRARNEPNALARIARHAEEAGRRAEAFDAYRELATQAQRAHRFVEAEQHYSAALAQLTERQSADAARCLAGRGRMRYRSQRLDDAVSDLKAARSIYETLGERAATAEILLDEATALDWMMQFDESAQRVEAARALIDERSAAALRLNLKSADGRVLARRDEWEKAIRLLGEAADESVLAGEHEIAATSLLVLAYGLVNCGELGAAEERFGQVIRLCEAANDSFHLGGAYTNRVYLWTRKKVFAEALADLRRVVEIARDIGFAQLERVATFNLAELLHFLEEDEEAQRFAQRALALRFKFLPEDRSVFEPLLLARIHIARGEPTSAKQMVQLIQEKDLRDALSDNLRCLLEMVQLAIDHRDQRQGFTQDRWVALLGQARQVCLPEEYVECLLQAASAARESDAAVFGRRWVQEAVEASVNLPHWRHRLDALRSDFSL